MKSIKPYLFFYGNCREAMSFYKDCHNCEIETIQTGGKSPTDFPAELSERIFNSELVADQLRLMASDVPKEIGDSTERRFSMFLTVKDAPELERLSERLSEGGKITMRLQNEFCLLGMQ